MTAIESLKQQLKSEPKTWLVSEAAGFNGSNLLETVRKLNQRVVDPDNFSTGQQRNQIEVLTLGTQEQWFIVRF